MQTLATTSCGCESLFRNRSVLSPTRALGCARMQQHDVHHDADITRDQTPSGRRMTVAQAASYLGISAEAVRARIQRGTLEHTREGKTVYVLVPKDRKRHNDQHGGRHDGDRTRQHDDSYNADHTVLVEELREQITYLREIVGTRDRELATRAEELAEMRRIVAALTQRIPPALEEAPAEHRESPVTPSEDG